MGLAVIIFPNIAGVEDLPAIGLFRNGQLLVFEGDEGSEKHILNWLKDEETLKIIGIIDEVSKEKRGRFEEITC